MKALSVLHCVLAGFAAGVAPALAEAAPDDGVYVRFGAGATFARDLSQDFTYNPDAMFATTPPTGQTIETGAGRTFAAAIGFDYADGIRTELEYRHASTGIDAVIADDPVNGPTAVAGVDDEMHAHLLMANFYFDFATGGPFTPYIGGGVGGALVENAMERKDGALALQARAGAAYAMGGGASLDLDVSYLRTNDLVYGPKDEDFTPAGEIVRADGARYEGVTVMLGLRKQF